jgi:hypothetical protein
MPARRRPPYSGLAVFPAPDQSYRGGFSRGAAAVGHHTAAIPDQPKIDRTAEYRHRPPQIQPRACRASSTGSDSRRERHWKRNWWPVRLLRAFHGDAHPPRRQSAGSGGGAFPPDHGTGSRKIFVNSAPGGLPPCAPRIIVRHSKTFDVINGKFPFSGRDFFPASVCGIFSIA